MDDQNPSPQSTLVVLLGASEWPNWPDLNRELSEGDLGNANAFAGSADGVEKYFLDQMGFNLPEDNLLNLFNSEKEPGSQAQTLTGFLKERIASLKDTESPATHLIVYYVGHGGPVGGDFFLAIRNSQKDNKIATSLTPKSLAEVIKNSAIQLRCFLIIDSCFAGATESAFVNTPINGVSLLGSSASDKASQLTQGDLTMFSRALLQVLKQGNKEEPEWFSLRMLGTEVAQEIRCEHGKNGGIPVIRSPVQPD